MSLRVDKIKKNKSKVMCYMIMTASFLGVLIFNFLTPYMADDFSEICSGSKSSFKDLFLYGVDFYMNHHGRSNSQVVRRVILEQDLWVFNVVNSIFFLVLIYFIYYNVGKRKKYDVKLYLFVTVLVWVGIVEFGETVLWKTGGVHYLWATTLIMGFFTIYRIIGEKWTQLNKKKLILIGLFIVGVLAGWCNENTSGGLLLYIVLCTLVCVYKKRKIFAYQIVSMAGVMTGLLIMILAPGYKVRAAATGETHSGILAVLSRFMQITNSINEHFNWIIILVMVISVIVMVQKGFGKEMAEIVKLMIVFLAVCYVLVLIPIPAGRIYFGAGIFLILACCQGFQLLMECDQWARIIQWCMLFGLVLVFIYTYIVASGQLSRIFLQNKNREEYIFKQISQGVDIIEVVPYEEIYRTKYSFIHRSDVTTDKEHWRNSLMSNYYGVDGIVIKMDEDK